jgi:hypothetical protein
MKSAKQKQKNLFEMLSEINDSRRAQGRMHDLRFILIIVIMSTMSGFHSLRAIGDFVKKNKEELIKIFKPKNGKLPSYLTIGRVLQNIDFDELSGIFYKWASSRVKIEKKEWLSIDGKAMGGTMSNYRQSHQKFISLVSIFAGKQMQVLHAGKINNKKESEIPKVREFVRTLGVKNAVLTMDALHCQKDTTKTIIENNNDYCIGVKGNQKKLYKQLKKT